MSGEQVSETPLVNTLIQELSADPVSGVDDASPKPPSVGREEDPVQVLASVMDRLGVEESFEFDEDVVKQHLDEILIALLGMRDGTHGKALIDDLSALFDADLSPGTVYPRLHDLRDDDVLAMHELVRTKKYVVDADDVAAEGIERAMYHHLVIGLFLHEALDEL